MLNLKLCMDFKVLNEISQLFLSHEFTDDEYFMFVYFRLTKARHIVCHVFPDYSETSTTNTDYLYREDEISQVYHLQCNQKRKKKDWNRIFRFQNKQVAIACGNVFNKSTVAYRNALALQNDILPMDFKVVNEINQLFYIINSLTRNVLCFFTSGENVLQKQK